MKSARQGWSGKFGKKNEATPDTNVLTRMLVADGPKQAKIAQKALDEAVCAAITITTLFELVWVLSRGYGIAHAEIGATIRNLIRSSNAHANRTAIEAGLVLRDQGGDFADGAIAFEGAALDAETLASFY